MEGRTDVSTFRTQQWKNIQKPEKQNSNQNFDGHFKTIG